MKRKFNCIKLDPHAAALRNEHEQIRADWRAAVNRYLINGETESNARRLATADIYGD